MARVLNVNVIHCKDGRTLYKCLVQIDDCAGFIWSRVEVKVGQSVVVGFEVDYQTNLRPIIVSIS